MRLVAGALLLLVSLGAAAQPRAWLDRDRIGAGETVTLNIETAGTTAPDYTPLQREFAVTGNSSRRQFELVNGRGSTRTLYAVALQPRRDGLLTIPSLRVGNERTQPLSLLVTAAPAAPAARAGADVFIESEADDQDPYVQQAVGWVVRLYSAVPLVSGQIDQAAPDGAALQRIGDDAQYTRQLGDRRYTVVERRFLLIPERSGSLTVPGATFEGRGAGGFFDDLFNDRGGALQARGAPRILQVRAAPANAPQPWLPLHGLQLRYAATPQDLRAGSAATLTIEATADGATAAQMPELQLPAIAGLQVFAEPAQADESFSNGRPRVKLTRKFSLVPARAGTVQLPGVRLGWWDVRAGAARQASLPPLTWQVAAGEGAAVVSPSASSNGVAARGSPLAPSTAGANRGWVLASLLFAALWLLTLVWALQHRARPAATAGVASTPAGATPVASAAGLKRALDTGDFAEVAASLCAMARPPARDLDEVIDRLDDSPQRAAVETMQRARWGDGDGVVARAALRSAFARGPRWRVVEAAADSPLPALYPKR
ncbi:MAG: BatD family protein [Lysobacter sp.]